MKLNTIFQLMLYKSFQWNIMVCYCLGKLNLELKYLEESFLKLLKWMQSVILQALNGIHIHVTYLLTLSYLCLQKHLNHLLTGGVGSFMSYVDFPVVVICVWYWDSLCSNSSKEITFCKYVSPPWRQSWIFSGKFACFIQLLRPSAHKQNLIKENISLKQFSIYICKYMAVLG